MTDGVIATRTAPTFPAVNTDHIPAQPLTARADHPSVAQDHARLEILVDDGEAAVGSHDLDGRRGGIVFPPPIGDLPRIETTGTANYTASKTRMVFDDRNSGSPGPHG
jgi:hypothetical protein